MKNGVKLAIVLKENEVIVSFPSLNGESDLKQSFYSDSPFSYEWSFDLFRYF